MSVLEKVMTFSEATKYLGKSKQYMNDLVKSGKLIEGDHYRSAGRVKLVKCSVVEKIKNNWP